MVSCPSTTREKSSLSARNAYEYHLKNWSDIQDHLPRLYEAAKGNCMEIGVRSGVSTSALLAGSKSTADISTASTSTTATCSTGIRSGHSPKLTASRIRHDQATSPSELDVLFVDGDHTYEGALADLNNFGPLAKRIFVHDTDAPDFPGVRRAVDEFAKQANRTVTYHSGSYGMAEIVLDRTPEIPGWMSAADLQWLGEQAKSKDIIVELGSYQGRSTRALGDNVRVCVFAVDDWQGLAP
jgi:hypothetical protein